MAKVLYIRAISAEGWELVDFSPLLVGLWKVGEKNRAKEIFLARAATLDKKQIHRLADAVKIQRQDDALFTVAIEYLKGIGAQLLKEKKSKERDDKIKQVVETLVWVGCDDTKELSDASGQ